MTTANESNLGKLHEKLAEVMLEALTSQDEAGFLLDEYKNEVPEAVLKFLEKVSQINPSLLTAITKFLKDNDITCQPEEGDRVSALQAKLAGKRRSVADIATIDPTTIQ